MKTRFTPYIIPALFILASCSPKGPYALTNKRYKTQTDSVLNVLAAEQPVSLADSTGAPIPGSWVGTVNFNARKPNYVIIHFTAQDSAVQTLKTFTIVKTQVSAHYVI